MLLFLLHVLIPAVGYALSFLLHVRVPAVGCALSPAVGPLFIFEPCGSSFGTEASSIFVADEGRCQVLSIDPVLLFDEVRLAEENVSDLAFVIAGLQRFENSIISLFLSESTIPSGLRNHEHHIQIGDDTSSHAGAMVAMEQPYNQLDVVLFGQLVEEVTPDPSKSRVFNESHIHSYMRDPDTLCGMSKNKTLQQSSLALRPRICYGFCEFFFFCFPFLILSCFCHPSAVVFEVMFLSSFSSGLTNSLICSSHLMF